MEHSDEKETRNRIEVVNEFIVACKQFDGRAEGRGLAGFLEDLALISDVDDWDNTQGAVTLMTCHCAKGLEFDHVYIIGLEEEMFPSMRSAEDGDLEEERRLCYVAMTRARKSLTLTAASERMLYGVYNKGRSPSRFLKEIGMERLHRIDSDRNALSQKSKTALPRTNSPEAKSIAHTSIAST